MPQTKQQLLDEVKKLGLKVEPSTKMADLREMIKQATIEPKKAKTEDQEESTTAVAKAGKRSSKALREAEEETKKQAQAKEGPVKPKVSAKPPRSRLERRSKKYRQVAEAIDVQRSYALGEAIDLIKKSSPVKFDASVELHLNLSVDPRQADQNIRDNLVLPAGSGRQLKIAALSEESDVALKAGATTAGGDELLQQIEKGNLDFDILIATPSFMPKLAKYARVLGPKGLMPNPKSGTVTNDIKKAITEAKAGKVEYRVDSAGIIHLAVGKVSFESSGLNENVMAVVNSVKANKPSSVKSNYLKSAYLTTSMGPSVRVDLASLNES